MVSVDVGITGDGVRSGNGAGAGSVPGVPIAVKVGGGTEILPGIDNVEGSGETEIEKK